MVTCEAAKEDSGRRNEQKKNKLKLHHELIWNVIKRHGKEKWKFRRK